MLTQTPHHLHRTTYDKNDCKIGVVHLGYGAFHRAHQAVLIDDYMDATGDLNWGIMAVNLRESETPGFANNGSHNDGYVLKTTSGDGENRYRLVRAHCGFVDWANDRARAEGLLESPSVSVVTITVTESGYYLDKDGNIDATHLVICAEIEGKAVSSIYGYLANALRARAANLGMGISILCCDNMRENGRILQRNFQQYLQLTNADELAAWVRDNVTFPCSMVDRITPRPSLALNEEICTAFGEHHADPIHAESYIQWVIENDFAGSFPALDCVGAQIVDDVSPYEEAKIRILNGGHSGLGYIGALAGHQTVDQAMKDPMCREHFDGWIDSEVLPALNIALPFDEIDYRNSVANRFANPAIGDLLDRICMDGYVKLPMFVLPTIRQCLHQGIAPKFGYDTIASWYIYARKYAADQNAVVYEESNWSALAPLLEHNQIEAFAKASQLWGDLPQIFPQFVSDLVETIKSMEKKWPM